MGVYIRLGSTNRVAGPEIVEELKRVTQHISFDQLPCPEYDQKALNWELIKRVFAKAKKTIDKKKLESLGILVPYGGKTVVSNGGMILFGQEPIRQSYFPNAMVRCAQFRGKDRNEFIDRYDVEGSIIEAMEEVPKFIQRNTRLAAKIEKIEREDIPEYSPIALREVLTNALVHTDYSMF